jgi:hypothetical protein
LFANLLRKFSLSSQTKRLGQPGSLALSAEYRGVEHSIDAMIAAVHSPRGATSTLVRLVAERVTHQVAPKDYLSEVLALRYWVNAHAHYMLDPRNVEWIRDPQGLLEEMARSAVIAGAPHPRDIFETASLVALDPRAIVRCDCDEFACLVASLWLSVGRKAEFVTVGFGGPGEPHSHVFTRVEMPKTPDAWIACDPVAGTKEAFMLGRISDFKTYPLD